MDREVGLTFASPATRRAHEVQNGSMKTKLLILALALVAASAFAQFRPRYRVELQSVTTVENDRIRLRVWRQGETPNSWNTSDVFGRWQDIQAGGDFELRFVCRRMLELDRVVTVEAVAKSLGQGIVMSKRFE